MNNFKVREINQQWGIIKHQAPLSTPIAISNRLQYSRRYSTIFQQFSHRTIAQNVFLDIFVPRLLQRCESGGMRKEEVFKLKMHRNPQ